MPLPLRFRFFAPATLLLLPLACTPKGGLNSSSQPRVFSSPDTIEVVIAATTDVHGRLRGWDYQTSRADDQRGLSRAATVVDSLRVRHPGRVVLVDAGDFLQGNPLAFVAARVAEQPVHPVIAAMNVMKYDAATIGNHEFNYGVGLLDKAVKDAGFPLLAGNVRNRDGRPRYPGVVEVEREGVRIAIVGATTPGSLVWDRENLQAEGLRIDDIVPYVRSTVENVRKRADVVVVVVHSGMGGGSSYDELSTGVGPENVAGEIAREIAGVDLVVLGHSHREVVDSLVGSTLVVQPRNWAASVAVAKLKIARGSQEASIIAKKGESVGLSGVKESEAVLAATKAAHESTLTWVGAPVGRSPVVWSSDSARVKDVPIVDFMLSVMQKVSGAELASTAAFSLDARFEQGSIPMSELARLYPYDNTLRAIRISGAQLREYLEYSSRYFSTLGAGGSVPEGGIVDQSIPGYNFDIVSGVDYVLDISRPLGERVTKLERNGRVVVATDSFTMALNNYRAEGGGGFSMLSGAQVVYDGGRDIRELLAEEIRSAGSISPSDYFVQNWSIAPSSAIPMVMAALRPNQANTGAALVPGRGRAASGAPSVPAGTRVLRVIGTNDIHGTHEPRPDAQGVNRGGAIALAAAIEKARRECTGNCSHILVDAGDMFTGTPGSDWQFGRPIVEFMNALGYAVTTLGNHEFDYGRDTMYARFREMKFNVLGLNVRGSDGARPSWVRPDTMVERGGIRIGITGAAGTHTSGSTKAMHVNDLKFNDPAPELSASVKSLRERGAEIVIAIIHDGGRCERNEPDKCDGEVFNVLPRLSDKPDIIMAAHSHTVFDTRIAGVPVLQASSNGRAIAVFDIPLTGSDREVRTAVRDVYGDSVSGANPSAVAVIERSLATVSSRLSEPVVEIAEDLRREGTEYALGRIIADAIRSIGRGDIAVWNNGGIRANLGAGTATMGNLHEIVPFANQLVRVRMRGSDVKRLLNNSFYLPPRGPDLHISGITATWTSSGEKGNLVESISLADGSSLDPNAVYDVILNDYMYGDPDSVEGIAFISAEVLPIRDIDALAAHLKTLPQPVRGPSDARIGQVNK